MATSFAPARIRRIAATAPNVIALDTFSEAPFYEEECGIIELIGAANFIRPLTLVQPSRIYMRAPDPSLKKKFRTETTSRSGREYRW